MGECAGVSAGSKPKFRSCVRQNAGYSGIHPHSGECSYGSAMRSSIVSSDTVGSRRAVVSPAGEFCAGCRKIGGRVSDVIGSRGGTSCAESFKLNSRCVTAMATRVPRTAVTRQSKTYFFLAMFLVCCVCGAESGGATAALLQEKIEGSPHLGESGVFTPQRAGWCGAGCNLRFSRYIRHR